MTPDVRAELEVAAVVVGLFAPAYVVAGIVITRSLRRAAEWWSNR